MRTIEHSIDIDAGADAVWRVLTDTGRYGEWSPFITQLSGRLTVGSRIAVTIRPGARTMTFRPTILAFDPGRRLSWQGRLGIPGIFDGRHEFLLQPTTAGTTRLTQRENFSGLLIPFLGSVLDDTQTGFRLQNEALLARTRSVRADA